jgi:hypothetical protein
MPMKQYVTIVAAFLFWIVASAEAQEGKSHWDQQGFQKIETFKKVRMMEVLKLDENLAIKFMTRYDKHEDRMRAIENERDSLIDKLQTLNENNGSDKEYDKTFDSLIQTNAEISDARIDFLNDMKGILTDKQIAQYIVFERNFTRDLRDIIRDVQRGHRGDH